MPFRYASEFRRQVCERMLAGESVKDLAVELSVSNPTLYKWRRQALIDVGRDPGIKSYEADRLAQARRKIADLEMRQLGLQGLPSAIADYIENFYNPIRRHSSIGYLTPDEHEALNSNQAQAAFS